jgi:hypothetical protein
MLRVDLCDLDLGGRDLGVAHSILLNYGGHLYRVISYSFDEWKC